ncbi:MAG: CCDC90 family protein [Alphaproteobacteria bacterium]
MAAITFDTLKFVHRLRDAGIAEPQAEAIAEAFKDASGDAELATRSDIARLEASTKADIKDVRGEMGLGFSRVQAEFAKLQGEVNLLKWMMGIVLAGILSLVLRAFFPHLGFAQK